MMAPAFSSPLTASASSSVKESKHRRGHQEPLDLRRLIVVDGRRQVGGQWFTVDRGRAALSHRPRREGQAGRPALGIGEDRRQQRFIAVRIEQQGEFTALVLVQREHFVVHTQHVGTDQERAGESGLNPARQGEMDIRGEVASEGRER